MRKSTITTTGLLIFSVVAFFSDVTKQGYMEFTTASDVKKILPNFTPPQFVKALEGFDKDCLQKMSQTQKVTRSQLNALRQLTDPNEVSSLLGNAYCETKTGFKWITESGKELNVKVDKTINYDFSTNSSLTNKERPSPKANGSPNPTLRGGISAPSPKPERAAVKSK